MEALQAGKQSSLPATGESHQRDAVRIHARMMRQDLECAINVENEIQPSERGLVGAHILQSASGKAIEREGRDAEPVEFARPHVHVTANAARAMLQYDDGQPSRALRNAQ